MADETLWKDDRPPTRMELVHYLVHVLGVPREDADRLTSAYNDEPNDPWSPESLTEYVDALVGVWRDDSGASDEEMESNASQAQARVTSERMQDEQRDASGQRARDASASAIEEIRSGVYNPARARWVTDIDSTFNVSQSIASGVMVGPDGNPVLDPNTGQPIPADSPTIFESIRNARFDMGALRFNFKTPAPVIPGTPLPPVTQVNNPRGIDGVGSYRNRYLTPSQVLNMLSGMSEDELTALQQKMYDAGLYAAVGDEEGARPDWGRPDPVTRRAFMELFVQASQRSGDSIDKVLADLTENHLIRGGPDGDGAGGDGQMVVDIPAFEPKVMSKETLGQMIDDLAQDMMGQYVDDDTKQSLIAKMQERETAAQRAAYDQSVGDIRGSAQERFAAESGGAGGGEIDAFMAAISSTESGGDYTASNSVGPGHYGKYQISNANWPVWAERAGLGRHAAKTPENQEIVAKKIMGDYYAQFGNWRDVAIAWFAGPGAVGRADAESRSDGNMTVREYADRAVDRMAQMRGGVPSSGLIETGGQIHAPQEQFDPQAELQAALKAKDPLGFEAHEFSERAVEWFSLLGGLV